MDISVLPNNNHPEKFLQLDVGMLPATHGMFQVGSVLTSQRYWQNRVYSQRERRGNSPPSPEATSVVFDARYLEKHITPVTLKSNIKRNPLYMDIRSIEVVDNKKSKPSWTVKEYDTQTIHGNLSDYLKKTPKDLDFWLEDLYTPGFDSLLKKKEQVFQCEARVLFILSALLGFMGMGDQQSVMHTGVHKCNTQVLWH
ncbi:major intrinsically disordered NOTCH2-binding receptor 1-like [Cottoperca gobio]|uniref:Major intrinsically disordered NOTCH2-binding receptor 1-like n=1 Tax=Cottoperca gobio TaxID=56716 RepID=A0A6J2QUT3_COTGO|nr:major intrinsically disordered NOTCH2-binding receptor 1-like [Cottoperca gobio]